MTSFPASKRTRIPVRTGLDSSLEAERLTFAIVSRKAVRSTVNSSPPESGRRGKSSALNVCRLYEAAPQVRRTSPSPATCSSVTSPGGRSFAMSTKSRPGTTTLPSDPTVASIPRRTDSSMSVAASSKRPSVARRRIPVRTWTLCLVETPRPTTESFSESSSLRQVILRLVSVAVSREFI